MALDLHLYGDGACSRDAVGLGVEEHEALVSTAEELGLPLFRCLRDYYQDVDIPVDALPALLAETEQLAGSDLLDRRAMPALTRLSELFWRAIAAGAEVRVLAD